MSSRTMSDEIVTIKGMQDGLVVSLSPTEDWQKLTQELATRIDEQSAFFNGAKVTVIFGERPVPKYELSSLKALLERRGLSLDLIRSESATTLDSANALDLRIATENPPPEIEETLPINPEESGTQGVMLRRTLRSGRTVHSAGHVVIYGDVNPGAKIIATGDVIVWGKLRGMVHAGAEGDANAIVCALEMTPNQLRIANFIAVSPPGEKRRKMQPEVASIREGQIIVEVWG